MAEGRVTTQQRKKRAHRRFWEQHGEKLRLVLIGGGVVLMAGMIARGALGFAS